MSRIVFVLALTLFAAGPGAYAQAPNRIPLDPATISHGALDASYLPLLERYERSDSPPLKYSAEFESARLTKQPDLDLWIAALSQQAGTPIQKLAVQVLGDYFPTRFKTDGRQSADAERRQLVTAAQKPEAVEPRLVPAQLPRPENISSVRQWGRFALVEVRFGSSGYSMLFERREGRWVFLCVVSPYLE